MASTELDMSLDEIIKQKKQASSRGGARGGRAPRGGSYGGRSAGPVRRTSGRGAYRASPYGVAKPTPMVTDGAWQHDLYTTGASAASITPLAVGAIETGTKLYVSNLDYGVSNEDVKELFSEIGDLKRCSVHYDRSGRSKGTAEVVFARKADAVAAMGRYNNVQLDGKPMKIELIGTNLSPAAPLSRLGAGPVVPLPTKRTIPVTPASNRAALAASYEQQHQIQAQGYRSRGGGAGGSGFRGRGRGRGGRAPRKTQQPQKTQEELDAELDSYHAEKTTTTDAMQT